MINNITLFISNYLGFQNQDNEFKPENVNALALPIFLGLGIAYFTHQHCCGNRQMAAIPLPAPTPPPATLKPNPVPVIQKINIEKVLAEKGFFLVKELPGESNIYMSDEHPDKLIKVGSFDPIKRAQHTKEGRDFVIRHGLKGLIVPIVEVENGYLVEERLPLTETSTPGQMGLYLNNTRLFDQAVVDFFKLLCIADIYDLTGSQSVLSCFFRFPTSILANWSFKANSKSRYDNVPLYIDKDGNGKMGLIDMEHFNFNSTHDPRKDLNWLTRACKGAIQFYPHHFDMIVNEAKAFNPQIVDRLDELEEYHRLALETYENVYVKHAAFFKANDISVENPFKVVGLNENIRAEIVDGMFKELNKPLITDPDRIEVMTLDYFFKGTAPNRALFEDIVDAYQEFNRFVFEKHLEGLKTKKNLTLGTIMEQRAIQFCGIEINASEYAKYPNESMYEQIYRILEKHQLPNDLFYFMNFIGWAKDLVFHQLVEKKIIAGYVPRVYGNTDCVLF